MSSPLGYDSSVVARHFERRAAEQTARVEALRVEASGALARLVDALVSQGAQRVWLFGSLVWGAMHEGSDIDLATEGLPGDALLRTQGEILLLAPCPVDLVRVEDASEALALRIRTEGRLLHG